MSNIPVIQVGTGNQTKVITPALLTAIGPNGLPVALKADANGQIISSGTVVNASTTDSGSFAIGPGSTTYSSYYSSAIGIGNSTAPGTDEECCAIGNNNMALGQGALAVGRSNNTSSDTASTLGISNNVAPNSGSSSALGMSNNVESDCSFSSAVGYSNSCYSGGAASSAFGYKNSTSGYRGSAFGYSNGANTNSTCAFGYGNGANANEGAAFGFMNQVGSYTSSAFGCKNTIAEASGYSSAFGYSNIVGNASSPAISASAFGYKNQALAYYSSAFGFNSFSSGQGSAAFGYNNLAFSTKSCSLGITSRVYIPYVTRLAANNGTVTDSGGHIRVHGKTGMCTMTVQNRPVKYLNAKDLLPAQTITSISRTGTVATATLNDHGFTPGLSYAVVIAGATESNWNGDKTIIITTKDQFTFTVTNVGLSSSTGGTVTQKASISRTGTTANVTLKNHLLRSGLTVTISGASQAEYNGNKLITKVDDDTFSFVVAGSPTTPATGTIAIAIVNDYFEKDNSIASGEFSIRRNGLQFILDYNDAGTVKSLTLGTVS
jgi:hypothetical protein